jgi:hypothetical protein
VTTPAQPLLVTAVSNVAPAGGDTITVTAPGRYRFVGGSTVTIGTGAAQVVGISTDSLVLQVMVGPGVNDTLRVQGLQLSGAPTLGPFTFKQNGKVIATAAPSLTLNKTSAVAGDTIIVTAPARYYFTAGAGGSSATVGAAGNALVGVSADSSQLRFLIGPSANSAVSVSGLRLNGAPKALGTFTLNSGAAVLTTPAIPNFAGVLSTATPTLNQAVTLTVPNNYRLLPTATVSVGGVAGIVTGISADSLTMTFVAPATGGAAAPPTVTGIVLTFLKTVSLTLPNSTNITPPALGGGLAGTGAFGTAPSLTLPAVGQAVGYFDGGAFSATAQAITGGPNRLYKITVPAGGATVSIRLGWNSTADVDIYYFNAANDDLLACFSGATLANPETGNCVLPAGDNFIAFSNFGAGTPTLLTIRVSRTN